MLAPHHAENSQLRERRLAAQRSLDPFIFFRRDAVVFDDFRGNGGSVCRGGHLFLFSHFKIPSGARDPYSHQALCPPPEVLAIFGSFGDLGNYLPLPPVPQLGFQRTYTIHPQPIPGVGFGSPNELITGSPDLPYPLRPQLGFQRTYMQPSQAIPDWRRVQRLCAACAFRATKYCVSLLKTTG